MRIVAVQGSPHKGNTFDRVERFGEALGRLGDVDFRHIALKDVHLEPCRGCFMCFVRGEDACPLEDDGGALRTALEEADAVVFATPVYSMHVSYLMKRFVDRFASTFHRPRYFGKYSVAMAVTGGVGLSEALKYVRLFAGSWGFEHVGELRYVDPPRNTALPRMVEEKDRTDEVARALFDAVSARAPRRLGVKDHLHFHVMRAVYKRMKPYSPADYQYWKERGWLEPGTRYFSENARAGILKSLYPRFVAWLLGRSMDKNERRRRAREEA